MVLRGNLTPQKKKNIQKKLTGWQENSQKTELYYNDQYIIQ